jgi:hypothetical protein
MDSRQCQNVVGLCVIKINDCGEDTPAVVSSMSGIKWEIQQDTWMENSESLGCCAGISKSRQRESEMDYYPRQWRSALSRVPSTKPPIFLFINESAIKVVIIAKFSSETAWRIQGNGYLSGTYWWVKSSARDNTVMWLQITRQTSPTPGVGVIALVPVDTDIRSVLADN